jgi:hypothetical protein
MTVLGPVRTQAEVLAAKRMIERSMERFALYPAMLVGDSAYGSAVMRLWLRRDARLGWCMSTASSHM